MFARLTGLSGLALLLIVVVGCSDSGVPRTQSDSEEGTGLAALVEIGPFLYGSGPVKDGNAAKQFARSTAYDDVVIPDVRLAVCHPGGKQEVPSQRDGVLLFIGTEIMDGETMPPDRLIQAKVNGVEKTYRKLREGDKVKVGQLLGVLDHRLALDDWMVKGHQVQMAVLDKDTSEKIREEAYQTYLIAKKLASTARENEELRRAEMTYQRYVYEALSKAEGIKKAEAEKTQSKTVLSQHQIRSGIAGEIRTIYKGVEESVKASEAVFLIHNCDRLQVEGLIEQAALNSLSNRELKVVVEPTVQDEPIQTIESRHFQEVTCVAVSRGPEPLIVSGSEDRTVLVFDLKKTERRRLKHPAAVRAVACTPAKAEANLVLSGAADGKGRLWDLDKDTPARELKGKHRGTLTCVAFSPDGKWCLTGGDDRDIVLWDVATGDMKYKFPAGHRGAVTSVYFTPQSQVVSAGRDSTLRVWTLGEQGARLEETIERRSGDVTNLGVSPDGQHAFYEQGKRLSILTIPEGRTETVLHNTSGAANFTTFALFSPDSRLILTAGGPEGRLQLWHPPTANVRGHEVRQLISKERSSATCAAFAPDGSFIVTGSRDRNVYIWPVPTKEQIEKEFPAMDLQVVNQIESGARQLRIRADLDNADGALIAGNTANLVIYPQGKLIGK